MEKRGFGRGTELSAKSFSSDRQFVVVVDSSTPFSEGGSAKLFMGTTKPPDSDAHNGAVAETVALKFFVANLASYQEQMIRRELRAAQKVAHRYILPYIGTTTFNLTMILISPYMRNGNLLQYLAGDPMRDWRPLVFQVATAVEFLHSKCNMVHGDLKCENVLVSNDGQALLADFGLCTCIDRTEKHTATAIELRGQNTFRYAAPELLLGTGDCSEPATKTAETAVDCSEPATKTAKTAVDCSEPARKTAETDVYAFGMTIIQACTRQHPWPECNHNRLLIKIEKREEHPRPSGTYARDFSDLWWELVRACCSYDPAARPTMSSALSKLAPFDPDVAAASSSDPTQQKKKKSHLPAMQSGGPWRARETWSVTADEASATTPSPPVAASIDAPAALSPVDRSPASPKDALHATNTSPTEPVPPITTGESTTRADNSTSGEASAMHLSTLTIVDTGAHAEAPSAEGTSDASSSSTGTLRAAGSLLDMSSGTRREGDPDIESSVGGTAMPAAPFVSYPSINSVIASIIEAMEPRVEMVISYPKQSQTASGRNWQTTLDVFRSTVDYDWGPHFCEAIFSVGEGSLENEILAISSDIHKNLLENTWTTIMTAIKKTGLSQIDRGAVNRVKTYTVDRKRWTANAKHGSVVVEEVQAWLAELTGPIGFDFQATFGFDREAAAHIVQAAGITINELRAPGRTVEDKKQTFLDLIILCHPSRFPPYIKIYRIALAVGDCTQDQITLIGRFNAATFQCGRRWY